ncbi:MAG: cell envelope biogenesis protein OmpA [Leptospira sp.]|nr:cell envelope biogenesis protein OmpA [Leptospira sp.]
MVSCNSLGIKLNETNLLPEINEQTCNREKQIRFYRILFLLPFYKSDLDELNQKEQKVLYKINEYAKPYDIGFTILGFLFSLNSSTYIYEYCNEADAKKLNFNSKNDTLALPYFTPSQGFIPAEQILFPKDDFTLAENEKLKLIKFAQSILKAETKLQILLVGKSNTSGDIAYQTRLVKRRADEIKSVFVAESISEERLHLVFSDKDFGSTDSLSTISIFIIKE